MAERKSSVESPVLFEHLEQRLMLDGSPLLPDGLIAHWEFDDASGVVAVDSSPNGNDGTLTNGPAWTAGVYGGALQFDGLDDWVDCGNDASLNPTTTELTFAAWVKTATGAGAAIGKRNSLADVDVQCTVYEDGEVAFNLDDEGTDWKAEGFPATDVLDGEWHHIAWVLDTTEPDANDRLRVYVDSARMASFALYWAPALNEEISFSDTIDLSIGAEEINFGGVSFFDGALDDVRIYDRALSEAEIETLAVNLESGLAAHWEFDDGSGTTAADSSGNGLHGALIGGPAWIDGVESGALQFDGLDDYVDAGDVLNDVAVPFSASAWVYRSAGERVEVLNSDNGSVYQGFWVRVTETGRVGIGYGDGGGAESSSRRSKAVDGAVQEEEWTHVAAVINGPTDMTIYVNGSDAGGTYSGSGGGMLHNSDPLQIGYGSQDSNYADGMIDDLRVYDRALTGAEVLAMMGEQPPFVVDDAYVVEVDGTLNVAAPGVLDNDYDPNDDPITADLVSDVSDGTLSLNADGSFTYTPDAAFEGTDSFTYRAYDGSEYSDPATVTINVTNVADGLVGYWTFDDGSGTTAADSSGNGNHGALTNDPAWTTGLFGGALSFDGDNDYVNCGTGASLNSMTTQMTLSLWVKTPDSSGCLIGKRNVYETAENFIIDLSSSRLRTSLAPYATWGILQTNPLGDAIWDDAWHLITWVYDTTLAEANDRIRVYLDANRSTDLQLYRAPDLNAHIPLSDEIPLGIGARRINIGGEAFFSGLMDDVRIYDRALSETEVQVLAEAPPVAVDDAFAVEMDDTLNVAAPGVLDNDYDVNDDPITTDLVSDVSDGTLALNADGSFTYTPDAAYVGTDSFTYRAHDGTEYSAPATVSIQVDPVPPEIVSSTPGDGDQAVAEAAAIQIAFNLSMNQPTVEAAFEISGGVEGTFSWAGNTLTFTPSADLAPDSDYVVTIGTGAESAYGDPLGEPHISAFTTGTWAVGTPLPASNIGRMLHLGSDLNDRITNATQGNEWGIDYFANAGYGPEYAQQPSPGQAIDLSPVTTSEDPLIWTDATDPDTTWGQGAGDDFVMYWSIYVFAPTTRQVKMDSDRDDRLRGWMDGDPQLLFDFTGPTGGHGTSAPFTLTAGWHCFVFKLWEDWVTEYATFRFINLDGSTVTDLQYAVADILQPEVAGVSPDDSGTGVPVPDDVTITFREVMDTTVDPATVATITGGSATGTWAWTSDVQLTWTPDAPLDLATTYIITVDRAAAVDLVGNPLAGQAEFSFTTLSLTDGLAAHWTFDDASGTTATDSSGNGNDGTLVGGPAWVDGVEGYALSLDGSDDHVTVPDDPTLDVTTELTIAAWIKLDTLDNGQGTRQRRPIVSKHDYVNGKRAFDFGFNDYNNNWAPHKLELVISQTPDPFSGGVYVSDAELSINRWYHVAVTFDGTDTTHMYVDGLLQPGGYVTGSHPASVATNDLPLLIGQDYDSGGWLDGGIDDVRIYDRALAGTEILAVMGEPPPFAVDDAYAVPVDGTLNVVAPGALDNDYDVNDDVITADLVSDVSDGALALNADGSFTYTPDALFEGTDSFTYRAYDGSEYSDPATVTLYVGDITDGLVAHWDFNDGSGSTATDITGNGHDGTLISSPTWTEGPIDGSLQFDGVDDYMNIGSADISGDWTASFWVNREESVSSVPLLDSDEVSLRLEQHGTTNSVGVTEYGVGDWAFDYVAPAGEWVHLTFVGSSTQTMLYVNGIFEDSMAHGIDCPMTNLGTDIGDPDAFVTATLDDARVYGRVLSDVEIAVLSQAPPIVEDDAYAVEIDGSLNVVAPGVLDNDTDPNGDPITADLVADVSNGTLALNADGSFTYTPTAAWAGTDSFTYRAYDGTEYSDPATVTVEVVPLQVTGITPGHDTIIPAAPLTIVVTFNAQPDISSFTTDTVQVVRSNGDGVFGDGDDVAIATAGFLLTDVDEVTVSLVGAVMPEDTYQITLVGAGPTVIIDMNGYALDGEFGGTFPSGDGSLGGDFVSTFRIMVPLFTDVTATQLPSVPGASSTFLDMDGDGDLDLVDANGDSGGGNLYLNDGTGVFSVVPGNGGVAGTGTFYAAIPGDFNNDGHEDFYLAGWLYGDLYQNDGLGNFTNVAASAGLTSPPKIRGGAFADFNNDGNLDLAVAVKYTTRLYMNDGAGYFTYEGPARGAAVGDNVSSLTAADFDGDADVDLLISSVTGFTALLENDGTGYFTNVIGTSGITAAIAGYVSAGDVDNDGDLDVYHQGDALYLNDGSGHFTDITASSGITLTVDSFGMWFDADHDGFLDLLKGDGLWLNDGDLTFTLFTPSGLEPAGDLGNVAVGDIDADGDLDVRSESKLLRNDTDDTNWLIVQPETEPGSPAHNAKVWVYEAGHLGDPARLLAYREILASSVLSSTQARSAHFGLPNDATVDVRVQFMSGAEKRIRDVARGQKIIVTEPDPTPVTVDTYVLTDDSGPSSSDQTTSDTTPVLTFTFSEPVFGADSDVTVTDPNDDPIVPDSIGTWGTDTIALTFSTPLALDGTYTVTLTGTNTIEDADGNPLNRGEDEVVTFTIDTVAPVVTVEELLTNDSTPQLTGTVTDAVDPLPAVTVTVNSIPYTATNNGDGTWTLADGTIAPLPEGVYEVAAEATDLAGNTSTDATADELTVVDVTAPSPDPATWAVLPHGETTATIHMAATTGSDDTPPVEYLFQRIDGETVLADSGWQASAEWTDVGLTLNTATTYRLMMRDSAAALNETAWSAERTAHTLAAVPPEPVLSNPTASTLGVDPDAGVNPPETELAVRVYDGVDYAFIQANGTLGPAEVWQTDAAWASTTVTGLASGVAYTVDVKARNGDGTETAYGPQAVEATNIPPAAQSVGLTPDPAYISDDLNAAYTYFDADGDPQQDVQIRWFRNDVPDATWNDQTVVPAAATSLGDLWYFFVRVSDGTDWSPWVQSPAVTVEVDIQVLVTAPNGGEVIAVDSFFDVLFDVTGSEVQPGDTVSIQYRPDAGSPWELCLDGVGSPATGIAYDAGSFEWSTAGLLSGSEYELRIAHETQPTVLDLSDAPFRILGVFEVSSITPDSGPTGSIITLVGDEFGDIQDGSSVVFGPSQVPAVEIFSWSQRSIRCRVPGGLSVGANDVVVMVESAPSDPGTFTFTNPAELHVDDDNATPFENGTERYPFNTIGEAVDAATSGDTIKVGQGTYRQTVEVAGPALYLRGGYVGGTAYASTAGDFDNGNRDWDANLTTIDGENVRRGVAFSAMGGEVSGFTITNGVDDSGDSGGGLYATNATNVTITHNVFEGNAAEKGGGIGLRTSALNIIDNLFQNNQTTQGNGGAIHCYDSDAAIITGNTFTDNVALDNGGAIANYNGAPTIDNNIFIGNTATDWGERSSASTGRARS